MLGITTGAMGFFTHIPLSQEGSASLSGLGFIGWYFWAGVPSAASRASIWEPVGYTSGIDPSGR